MRRVLLVLVIVSVVMYSSCIKAYAFDPGAYPFPLTDLAIDDGAVPETVNKGSWVEFNGTGYNYDTDHDVNQLISHVGGESKYDQDGLTDVLQKCYQTFLAWGMCPEGAAAVCGNISCESGGDPSMFGPNWAKSWDECLVKEGGTFKGLRWFDPYSGGDDIDMGFGLIAFTAQCWCENVWYIAGHQDMQWTDLGTQLLVLSYEFGPRSADNGDDPAEEGKFFHPFYDDSSDGRELEGKFNWNAYSSYFPSTAFENTGEGKCARLTCAYMANCERPGGSGNVTNRASNAIKFYNDFKDLEPVDYSEGGTAKEKKKVDDNKYGVVSDQWELLGMPSKSGLVVELVLPGVADRKSLSTNEVYNVSIIGSNIQDAKSLKALQMIRVSMAFVGLLLITYGILLLLCMLFDIWNNFFDFSLVGIVTLGGVNYSPDKDMINNDDGKRFINTKRMILTIVVLIFVGCLIISGTLFPFIIKFAYRMVNSS